MTLVRRLFAVCTLVVAAVALMVVGAGAASADTPLPRPDGWEPKPDIDLLHAFALLGGVPLLVFILITLLYVGPALARGESLSVKGGEAQDQWLGGPGKGPEELAAPDAADSSAGGAGGSW